MFAQTEKSPVQAMLDWEAVTLGDPLAVWGYLAATYPAGANQSTVMELTKITRAPDFRKHDELMKVCG